MQNYIDKTARFMPICSDLLSSFNLESMNYE